MRECHFFRFRLFPVAITLLLAAVIFAGCSSTKTFLAKGEEFLKKRKFHDAMMQFRSAAESDPGSAAAHWGLARAYENLGQFNEVLDELRKTVELDETNIEAKARLGNYFLLLQPPMISETERLRNEILEQDPNFIEGHILSASIMAAQNKPDAEVIAQVNKAIAMDPQRIESYISLQRMYTTRGNLRDAEATLKRGLEANPTSVLGHTEYGKFLTDAQRDADAEAQFNKAIAIDANSVEAHEARAEFYVISKQHEKAEATYRKLIEIQENSPESRLVLASFYTTVDRDDEAIASLEQIVADSPEYVLARYRLGQLYLERKELTKTYEQVNALLKVNDDDFEALMLRARARMQEGKDEDAVKDVEEVLKKKPSQREALYLITQAKLSLGQTDQANAFIGDLDRYHPTFLKTHLLKIQAAFAAGDATVALTRANELVAKTEATQANAATTAGMLRDLRIKGISSRGLAFLELDKLPEAESNLREALKMTPKSSSAMVNLAKVFIAQRRQADAQGLYENALNADATNFDAVSGIVNTSIALNQTAKAHTRIAELIGTNAGRGDVIAALHYLNATVFTAEKDTSNAEKELLAAIELDPDYLPAYSSYATLLVSQNRADEAIAQYKKVIEKRPNAQVFTMLGILEDGRGNGGEAEASYRKALDISPESPIAANNLAWLIAENGGNLDEALQLATAAVGKNQSVAQYYDTLGYVYLKKGLMAPAVEQLKKAVALSEAAAKRDGTTADPSFKARLGMAIAKAGDKTAASVKRSPNEIS